MRAGTRAGPRTMRGIDPFPSRRPAVRIGGGRQDGSRTLATYTGARCSGPGGGLSQEISSPIS
jgi:hypothetical protein